MTLDTITTIYLVGAFVGGMMQNFYFYELVPKKDQGDPAWVFASVVMIALSWLTVASILGDLNDKRNKRK